MQKRVNFPKWACTDRGFLAVVLENEDFPGTRHSQHQVLAFNNVSPSKS